MITQDIKNKISEEANWRSTNGHGGVDDITRDNFILAGEFGYGLSWEEIETFKDAYVERNDAYNKVVEKMAEIIMTFKDYHSFFESVGELSKEDYDKFCEARNKMYDLKLLP